MIFRWPSWFSHYGGLASVIALAVVLVGGVASATTFPLGTGQPFPWDTPGTSIGAANFTIVTGTRTNKYEPSGLVWHPRLQRLYGVSDGSQAIPPIPPRLFSMTTAGTGFEVTDVAGDLEGITFADPASDFLYIGLERIGLEQPNGIAEFSLTGNAVTRTFDLSPWMTGAASQGLEALTFVPDPLHAEGGLFYAGLQQNGTIYKFELPLLSSPTSTAVTFVGSFQPVVRNDLSGLHYDRDRDVLFAIYDEPNLMRAMNIDGSLIEEWTLPGVNQEGLALVGNVLYIAEDSGAVVQYVPEPSTVALAALGITGLAWSVCRRRVASS